MKKKIFCLLKNYSPLFLGGFNLVLTQILLPEISLFTPQKAHAQILETMEHYNGILTQNFNHQFDNHQIGQTIILNNRTFTGGWLHWVEQGKNYLALSDISAMQLLGIDLLDTNDPQTQPIKWYGDNQRQNLTVNAQFINPYRYIDLTNLLTKFGFTFRVENDNLILEQKPVNIHDITSIDRENQKEILVTLDQPTPWQISENNQEAVITLSANIDPSFLEKFAPPINPINQENNPLVDDISEIETVPMEPPLLILESANNHLKFKINKPANYGVKISSLQNPNRLKIELRSNPLKPVNILWHQGLRLQRQYIALPQVHGGEIDYFPVSWLEIDLKSPQLRLKPIYPNSDTIIGIEPLLTTARNLQVLAGVNGGFFNRNNQYPLGAIRNNYTWLSSPILSRGAMAWNEQGSVRFSRLIREEMLTNQKGTRLPILFLNSGYVKAGIARYNSEWGTTYSPLTDNEIIVTVINNQIVEKAQGSLSNFDQFSIPNNGYLLVFRSYQTGANQLEINDLITLENMTNPPEFEDYPYIIGGGPLLIQNNQIVLTAELEGFSEAFIKQRASRSAIALNREGKLMIVVTHNRVNGAGPSLAEWAQILQGLGAVNALNLDGGSSTSLYLGGQLLDRSPVTAARVNNGLGLFFNP